MLSRHWSCKARLKLSMPWELTELFPRFIGYDVTEIIVVCKDGERHDHICKQTNIVSEKDCFVVKASVLEKMGDQNH